MTAPYVLDHATETQLEHWRACNDRGTERALGILRRLGAVTIEDGAVEPTELGQAGMRRLLGELAPGDPIYQVKVTLMEVENPPVWRRVLVPATVRLDRLHEVIQAVMGWQNAHLHAFIEGQTYYGVPDAELQYRRPHNEVERPGEAGRPPPVHLRLRRRLGTRNHHRGSDRRRAWHELPAVRRVPGCLPAGGLRGLAGLCAAGPDPHRSRS